MKRHAPLPLLRLRMRSSRCKTRNVLTRQVPTTHNHIPSALFVAERVIVTTCHIPPCVPQADRIQVAINLNGYTKGARNEIFALWPAPVQTSYMGFPATTGASFLPYLITDKVRLAMQQFRCHPSCFLHPTRLLLQN